MNNSKFFAKFAETKQIQIRMRAHILSAVVIIPALLGCNSKPNMNQEDKEEKYESTSQGGAVSEDTDGTRIEIPGVTTGSIETKTDKDETKAIQPREKRAEKPEKPEKPAIEPRGVLNDSPYPIAPGHHKFTGKAEGQYPIVVYIDVTSGGNVSGKMAYKSTLEKYGDTDDHYMYFTGARFSGRELYLSVDDNKGNHQEWELHVSDNGNAYKLRGSAYSYTKDKTFSIDVSGR